ncbi:MAG: hypothetical protein JXJ04_22045 [Spirochaetales bacterium]|nr:hypothetical protein [Spirochaetales bacterium]
MQYGSKKFTFNYIAASKGILWFFPSLVFIMIFLLFWSVSYKPFNYYFYYLLRDHFLFCALAITGYFVFYGFSHPRKMGDPFLNLFSFFSGFFFLVALKDLFSYTGELNFYLLFIMPFLRLFTIVILSFFMDKFIDAYGSERIIYGGLLFLVPVSAGLVSYFYNINLSFLSFILSFLFFAGAGAASYFLKDI